VIKLAMLGVASLLGNALWTGCADRVTGPEAVQLIQAFEESSSSDTAARRTRLLTHGLSVIWAGPLSRLHGVSDVTVRRNGKPLRYRAVVLERVVRGLVLDGHPECDSTYVRAFLWSEGTRPDGLMLQGGQFDQRLSPSWVGGLCRVNYMLSGATPPSLFALTNDDDSSMNNPWVKDGEADISKRSRGRSCCRGIMGRSSTATSRSRRPDSSVVTWQAKAWVCDAV
jgi:hypothetical protein